MRIEIRFDELTCLDEGDGAGVAAPYVWPLYFRIDEAVLELVLVELLQEGAPLGGFQLLAQRVLESRGAEHFTAMRDEQLGVGWAHAPGGQHGNLRGEMDAGDHRRIPADVGQWITTPEGGMVALLPEQRAVGAIFLLLEEDDAPLNSQMDGMYREKFVRDSLNAILDKAKASVLAYVGATSSESFPVADIARALGSTAAGDPLEEQKTDEANAFSKAVAAFNDVDWYVEPIDIDDAIGLALIMFTEAELTSSSPRFFARLWGPETGSEDGGYAMTGRVTNLDAPDAGSAALLWKHTDGRVSLWRVNALGEHVRYVEHGPFPGWEPVNFSKGRLLWRHPNGAISLWRINEDGTQHSYKEHGPIPGWTALRLDGDHLLWTHEDGRVSRWVLDADGEQVAWAELSVDGWRPVSYSSKRLLWRHGDGRLSLWSLGPEFDQTGWQEFNPGGGWRAFLHAGDKVVLQWGNGNLQVWRFGDDLQKFQSIEVRDLGGWTAASLTEDRLLMRHQDGQAALWRLDPQGHRAHLATHGPYAGWTPFDWAPWGP